MPNSIDLRKSRSRKVSLFRNGKNQAVRIPREFEFPCREVVIKKEDDHLILEPIFEEPDLLSILSNLRPLKETFPDMDETLLENDEIEL